MKALAAGLLLILTAIQSSFAQGSAEDQEIIKFSKQK